MLAREGGGRPSLPGLVVCCACLCVRVCALWEWPGDICADGRAVAT